MENGIYEQLINKLISDKLNAIHKDHFYIKEQNLDKAEASIVLSNYLANIIRIALSLLPTDNGIKKQILITNKIIRLLNQEINGAHFNDDLIETAGKVLTAIFPKLDAQFSDFDQFLKEITPVSRLTQSELFTGSNAGISTGE